MTGTMTATTRKPVLWTATDWNAFFGFGTNILVNMASASVHRMRVKPAVNPTKPSQEGIFTPTIAPKLRHSGAPAPFHSCQECSAVIAKFAARMRISSGAERPKPEI